MTTAPFRACSGSVPLGGTEQCGNRSTVICTKKDDGPRPLQWYACDNPEHRGESATESIEEWFARLYR